jgi:hypothetical protein
MLRVRISGGWEHRDHATGRPIRWAIRQGHKGFADTLNDSAATCEHSKSIAIEVGFCNVFNTCARLSPSTPLKKCDIFRKPACQSDLCTSISYSTASVP